MTPAPLVVLAARLVIAFCLPIVVLGLGRVVLGGQRARELADAAPRARAHALAVASVTGGALLGWDALDPRLVGVPVATHDGARIAAASLLAMLALLPLLSALRVAAGPLDARQRASALALATAALVVVAAMAFTRHATRLVGTPYDPPVLARAPLRAAIVPSDAMAWLTLAYVSATNDRFDEARERLTLARSLGAAVAPALEIESELFARLGDCETAERLFRFSLETRVPVDLLGERLDLRGFRLPTSLVTRCGYGRPSAPGASPTR